MGQNLASIRPPGLTNMKPPSDLTPLEAIYQEKLRILFERVDAQKPEKGISTLLQRAREKMIQTKISHEQALVEIYEAAVERTERRIALINASLGSTCSKKNV